MRKTTVWEEDLLERSNRSTDRNNKTHDLCGYFFFVRIALGLFLMPIAPTAATRIS